MRRKKRAEAPVPRETVERAARVYSSNTDAAAALGIAAGSFGRLCRRHGIEPPPAKTPARAPLYASSLVRDSGRPIGR